MKRYVLRYRGSGKPDDLDVNGIRSTPGLKIVVESSPTMFLVEATDEGVQQLKDMSTWLVSPETFVPVPDTREKVRQPS
jgi:hypothetical protein